MDFNKFSKTVSYGHFETLDHGKPVWIFGAGGFARSIAKVLISEGFQVYGFVVSDPKEKTLLDLPIVSWKDVTWEMYNWQWGCLVTMCLIPRCLLPPV